jgi:hypothetical protein
MGGIEETCYGILGLPEGASREEVEEAFGRLKSESEGNWERLKEITWAYETLADCRTGTVRDPATFTAPGDEDKPTLTDLLFPTQVKVNPLHFWGRCLVFVLLVVSGVRLMVHLPSSELAGHSFFHFINLPFHEAGHIVFRLFGDFMGVLGGSLMQVIIPIVCLAAFLKRGDAFAASFALWWTGQNFIDMAPYINDARAQQLMLLGGVTGEDVPGYHDWNNILGHLGLLNIDHSLANTSHIVGSLLMTAAFIWAAIMLSIQWKNRDSQRRTV